MANAPAPTEEARGLKSNLALRIMAALVLAPLALGAAYAGGWWWNALAVAVGAGIFAEWAGIVGLSGTQPVAQRLSFFTGLVALVAGGLALCIGQIYAAALALLAGLVVTTIVAPSALRGWAAGGFLYAAAAMTATIIVRTDSVLGFTALMFVFAIVWGTDILGYFVGRGVGGPKLWPRVSPKKTWSGALGGLAGSAVAGAAFAWSGAGKPWALIALALVLSVLSQAGDLFESAVKRRFDVKDSSHIIPGHGGLMDRLDGYIAVIVAAAIIGVARGGFDAAARGLLAW